MNYFTFTQQRTVVEGDDTEKRCIAVVDNQLSLFPVLLYSWEPRHDPQVHGKGITCRSRQTASPLCCKIIKNCLQFWDFKNLCFITFQIPLCLLQIIIFCLAIVAIGQCFAPHVDESLYLAKQIAQNAVTCNSKCASLTTTYHL